MTTVEMTARGKRGKPTAGFRSLPTVLGNRSLDSHIPTVATATHIYIRVVNRSEGTREVSSPFVVMSLRIRYGATIAQSQVPYPVWYQPVLLAVDLEFHLCFGLRLS